jgi:hypothetical protein
VSARQLNYPKENFPLDTILSQVVSLSDAVTDCPIIAMFMPQVASLLDLPDDMQSMDSLLCWLTALDTLLVFVRLNLVPKISPILLRTMAEEDSKMGTSLQFEEGVLFQAATCWEVDFSSPQAINRINVYKASWSGLAIRIKAGLGKVFIQAMSAEVLLPVEKPRSSTIITKKSGKSVSFAQQEEDNVNPQDKYNKKGGDNHSASSVSSDEASDSDKEEVTKLSPAGWPTFVTKQLKIVKKALPASKVDHIKQALEQAALHLMTKEDQGSHTVAVQNLMSHPDSLQDTRRGIACIAEDLLDAESQGRSGGSSN